MLLETVRVKSDDTEFGYVIINKSDFNASEHVLFDDAAEKPAKSTSKATK